jgi:hypothetical protein
LNLALYAAYAGDFKTAEQEARETEKLGGALAMLPMAFAQLGQGQLAPATDFYQQLAKVNPQGAFYAASGLADLAVYEGRFSDAVRILEESAAASVKSNNSDRAASHLARPSEGLATGEQRGSRLHRERPRKQSGRQDSISHGASPR